MQDDGWVSDVLGFWFDELRPEDWFVQSDSVDEKIRQRFASLYDEVSEQALNMQPKSARHALAAVIVLDQFPRNLFRGSPKAFATDAAALALANRAIELGVDAELTSVERQFLYMPYQHSEDVDVQAKSVELYARLDKPEALDFAVRHKEIIDRFGRFPHRNEILGRLSTPAEIDFLQGPNSSF